MIENYFTELSAFNLSTTNTVCSWLEKISDEQWNASVISSFGSIQETVLHVISAENAWVERFHKKENVVRFEDEFQGTREEHIALWKNSSEQFKNFVTSFDETKLNDEFSFKRFNGAPSSAKYYQAFAHAINHATYHRGQIVTMLRQVGFAGLQSTDLIGYYRF